METELQDFGPVLILIVDTIELAHRFAAHPKLGIAASGAELSCKIHDL